MEFSNIYTVLIFISCILVSAFVWDNETCPMGIVILSLPFPPPRSFSTERFSFSFKWNPLLRTFERERSGLHYDPLCKCVGKNGFALDFCKFPSHGALMISHIKSKRIERVLHEMRDANGSPTLLRIISSLRHALRHGTMEETCMSTESDPDA